MIDWLTIKCPHCPGLEVDGGKIVFIKPDGTIDYMVDKFFQVVGSFDDRVSLVANETEVIISGNPSKWLQGHNLFGIENFERLFNLFFQDLSEKIGFDSQWLSRVLAGDFEINRIDITYSYRLKSQGEVIKWLNAMQQVCTGKRQALSRSKGTTVYIGKHSRRSAIKFYDKEGELTCNKDHMLSKKFNSYQEHTLKKWVKGVLRCEVVLRKKCLKDEFKLTKGTDFLKLRAKQLRAIFMKKLSTVNFPKKFAVSDFDLSKIKQNLRACYTLWQEGFNILEVYPRATAYRYRRQFLKEYGVDIFLQSPREYRKTAQVLPLLRPLEAVPCEFPEDAYELGLLAA